MCFDKMTFFKLELKNESDFLTDHQMTSMLLSGHFSATVFKDLPTFLDGLTPLSYILSSLLA